VIVVLMIVEVFVSRDSVGQIDFTSETTVGQQFHCAIHRRIANPRVLSTHNAINVLYTPMTFVAQESVEDELPVRGQLKLAFLQVLHKDLHLGNKRLHGAGWDGGSNFTTSL